MFLSGAVYLFLNLGYFSLQVVRLMAFWG